LQRLTKELTNPNWYSDRKFMKIMLASATFGGYFTANGKYAHSSVAGSCGSSGS
jgi:hypothetical protein